VVKLTDAELKLKTGLFEMVTSPLPVSRPRCWMFPTKELENELTLRIPHEVRRFTPVPVHPIPAVAPIKKKQTRPAKANMEQDAVVNDAARKKMRGDQGM
jgi:hypothetical protein